MGAIERRKPVMVPLPDAEPKHRSPRPQSQWCRGRVGVDHLFQRLNDWTFFCQQCGKQRYQRKDFSLKAQVKAIREAAGYTQEALAERLRISIERIKEIEGPTYTGAYRNIRLSTLEAVASVCDARLVIRFEREDS